MNDVAAAISRAHVEWKGCLPSQCTRECPHIAPPKRPSRELCMRYAEHLASAAQAAIGADADKTWCEAFGNSDPKEPR